MNYEARIGHYEGELDWEQAAARKRRNLIIGALVAVLVLAGAWFLFSPAKPGEGAAGDKSDKSSPTVTVMIPGRTMVDAGISATGTLAARREMPVGVVGEGGLVTRVWVEAGSWVRAGQVLASIERSVQSQQTSQIAAQIAAADANARLAQNELERAQALAGRGFISKAEIDRKMAQRDAAAAQVRVARAQLGQNRALIGRLDIRAPASGLVLTRGVEPGQVVGAGSGVLFRIAKGGEMEMQAQLSEADLVRLSTGLAAKVTPVGTTISVEGQIWQIAPVINPQSRQGLARIALPYNQALRPGGFASATILAGQAEAPLLPESAVLSDVKGNYVFLVDPDNKVQRRDVKVGTIGDQGVSILEGLSGTEKVVRSAGGFLNAGESVIPNLLKAAK
jgi:HlyD family secretion protein